MDKQAEIARIKAEYEARNKEIERQHRQEMAKIIGGGLLSIGSAFIPGTAGLKVAGALGKTIAPMVGKKIGTEIASGLVSGGLSGAVEGLGRGLIENKNPLKTMAQDSAVGLATGGLGGLAVGKIGQNIARKSLPNNPTTQKQYFDDYIADLSNKSKAMADYRGLSQGARGLGNGVTMYDSANPRHRLQADLINKYNPKPENSSMTWIENADDIYNFEDTLKDSDWADYIGDDFDPSYSWDMAQEAIKNGQIEVYSSHPIDKGIFVSPSRMEAESYAGTGEVFSKKVPLEDVAWIDPTQGQYAPTNLTFKEQFAKDLAENSRIQNAIDKINNNPNKPLQELIYRNGEQVGYGDYFNYDDDAIYIDYLRNITKDTPNYQKGVGSEIVDKILQNNPNKNIIWDTVDDNAEAFKQAYLKKHPELTPYVFQQGDYDQLVALAKDQGYNIKDYLELLRGKSKKTGL
jgi:hypothetical protein